MAKSKRPEGPPDAANAATDGGAALLPERLLRINRLAMQARFVAGMAHEVNNSLQVMGGIVELLTDRSDLPDDVRTRLQRLGDQADRVGGVVRQVLGYTRGEGGHRQRVDLVTVIERAVALRRYQLGRLGIELAWDAAASPRVAVEGDEPQLQQALLNLIVNAEEALEAVPERRLRITVDADEARVRCAVADSGPGIDAALRERVFEPFFTTRQSARNVGLGLPAVAAIVAAHHGRVQVSDGRSGATLILELPRGKT